MDLNSFSVPVAGDIALYGYSKPLYPSFFNPLTDTKTFISKSISSIFFYSSQQ